MYFDACVQIARVGICEHRFPLISGYIGLFQQGCYWNKCALVYR